MQIQSEYIYAILNDNFQMIIKNVYHRLFKGFRKKETLWYYFESSFFFNEVLTF